MSGCSSCASSGSCSSEKNGGCSSGFVPQFTELAKGCKINTVIAVGSGKGGVGKSTVTSLLAVMLKRQGLKVGILDADITGPSMGQAFGLERGVEPTEDKLLLPPKTRMGMPLLSLNLLLENKEDPVIWRGPVIAGVIKQFWGEAFWGELDVLLLDMPPGTGDVPLTVFQSIPVDRFLVVSTPQDLVQMIVAKACKMAEMMNVPVMGLVENMSSIACPDCEHILYPFGKGKTKEAAAHLNIPFLDELSIDPHVNVLMDGGQIESYPQEVLQNSVSTILKLVNKKKEFFGN